MGGKGRNLGEHTGRYGVERRCEENDLAIHVTQNYEVEFLAEISHGMFYL